MAAYREAIGLDMTVPDFSTKKIDAKVMGTRLAGILEYMLENYTQGTYERQIALMIGENAKKLKKAKLVFNFFDGVSEDVATNDFFTNVCRYIR